VLLEVYNVMLTGARGTAEDAGVDLVVAHLEPQSVAEERPRRLEVLDAPDHVVDGLRARLDAPASMLVQPLDVVGGVDLIRRGDDRRALPYPHAERDAAVGGEVDRAVVVTTDLAVNCERRCERVEFLARA